jgi:hypothetical protein
MIVPFRFDRIRGGFDGGVVTGYAAAAGVPGIATHDLRRYAQRCAGRLAVNWSRFSCCSGMLPCRRLSATSGRSRISYTRQTTRSSYRWRWNSSFLLIVEELAERVKVVGSTQLPKFVREGVLPRGVPAPRDVATASHNLELKQIRRQVFCLLCNQPHQGRQSTKLLMPRSPSGGGLPAHHPAPLRRVHRGEMPREAPKLPPPLPAAGSGIGTGKRQRLS